MTYNKNHNDDVCDRCTENVGKCNLLLVPFLYMDKNDDKHPNYNAVKKGKIIDWGYRQYYVCKSCMVELKKSGIKKKRKHEK